jgi:hypothetical protein
MAEISKYKDRYGNEISMLNVTYSVGTNAVNKEDDVMMIKAMLHYVGKYAGFAETSEIPYPSDGTIGNLSKLIRRFQKNYNIHSVALGQTSRLAVDGRINHAKSKYVWGTNRPWTMAALNEAALDLAHLQGKGSAVEALAEMFPHLRYIFNVKEYFE